MEQNDTLTSWQVRLKTGFGPKKPKPTLPTYRAPDLTEQEQQERTKDIEAGILPF